MSIDAMAWAIRQNPKDHQAKLLLICMGNYADEQGWAWPSIRRMMRDTSMSESTIKRRLIKLVSLGFLKVEQRFNEEGGQKSNRYQFPPSSHGGVSLTPPQVTVDPQENHQKRGREGSKGLSEEKESKEDSEGKKSVLLGGWSWAPPGGVQ